MANNQIDLGQMYGLTQNNNALTSNIPTPEELRNKEMSENQSYPTIDSLNGINDDSMRLMEDINRNLERIDNNNTENNMSSVYSEPVNLQSITNATPESVMYLNGFLNTQIGRMAEVQFVAGNNQIIVLTGTIMGVGTDFLLIKEQGTNTLTTCKFKKIELIRLYY